MDSFDIVMIILTFGVVGWIPIWFFFDGIEKIIRAFRNNKYVEDEEEE